MKGKHTDIPDFSDLTCTNLMIRLKMLLKKTPPGVPLTCYVRRDQRDTIEVPFARSGYEVTVKKADTHRYRVSLTKKETEMDL
ncbi:MAG: hypothetical protein GX651_00880 [Methanomicrobiales archaeon]|nr:hypothetical protein [Methanomicrobiales archaeon]